MKRGVKYLWEGEEGSDRHNTRRGGRREKKEGRKVNSKGTKISRNKRVLGGRGERERKYFRKAEQEQRHPEQKHQDAIEINGEKMAATDLCVVSDGNGTMKITDNCVVCHRLSCILVTCHVIPSS